MLRFIAKLLIVALLALNFAWASDECAFIISDDSGGMYVQADQEPSSSPSNTDFDCDDWCHVWANPVALHDTSISSSYNAVITVCGFITRSYCSRPITPPLHPPIV